MPLDVAVLGDDYRYLKHLHIDRIIHGVLFKKVVTPEGYPSLGRAQYEEEDITFTPEDIPALTADLDKLEAYIKNEATMSGEVKGRCMEFVSTMRDICETALEEGRNVEFIAGE